jgi:hypothetical protein
MKFLFSDDWDGKRDAAGYKTQKALPALSLMPFAPFAVVCCEPDFSGRCQVLLAAIKCGPAADGR